LIRTAEHHPGIPSGDDSAEFAKSPLPAYFPHQRPLTKSKPSIDSHKFSKSNIGIPFVYRVSEYIPGDIADPLCQPFRELFAKGDPPPLFAFCMAGAAFPSRFPNLIFPLHRNTIVQCDISFLY
jgi:hypothetical protein